MCEVEKSNVILFYVLMTYERVSHFLAVIRQLRFRQSLDGFTKQSFLECYKVNSVVNHFLTIRR